MGYQFVDNQLKVCGKYLKQQRNRKLFEKARIIILEHILETTENLIKLLEESGAEIFSVIAKPYSIDQSVLKRLLKKKYSIINEDYKILEETDILYKLLKNATKKSETDGKEIIIIDVGGYFLSHLMRLNDECPDLARVIKGVIEDTTFGHNRYLKEIESFQYPIFSVARSPLKEIEARFVGRDIVNATEQILRKSGILMSGRKALVVGYGMIGKNIALNLRRNDMDVYVYDSSDEKNLHAFIDGYKIHKRHALLPKVDIIFFATGNPNGAFTVKDMNICKNGVILVSGGSKNTEFDIDSLIEETVEKPFKINKHMLKYKLDVAKDILVLNNGTAVNFILPTLPTELLDIVFAEIVVCACKLLKHDRDKYPVGVIHSSGKDSRGEIAKDWLSLSNRD
ncbi:NAD(P)-dependent oxidoreductase [Streptococcus australis]|uniref:NUDIX family hydrolase n=1 Tax=Streptococcus australis TaxID=113107 RepID=A0A4V0BNN5_9STRE|nr:NAD(P)-dependent oxidoreductase [Streptococcus australis]VTS70083.1 NUDIX family hydrolase [Streptococcus australis]